MDGWIDLTEDDVLAIAKVGIESNLMLGGISKLFSYNHHGTLLK